MASSRPAKRRRLVVDDDDDDEENIEPIPPSKPPAQKKQRSKRQEFSPEKDLVDRDAEPDTRSKPKRGRPKKNLDSPASVDQEERPTPKRGRPQKNPESRASVAQKKQLVKEKPTKEKKGKHRIYTLDQRSNLDDRYCSQLPVDLSSSPGRLRGAIWVRPASNHADKHELSFTKDTQESGIREAVPVATRGITGVGFAATKHILGNKREQLNSDDGDEEDAFEPFGSHKTNQRTAPRISAPVGWESTQRPPVAEDQNVFDSPRHDQIIQDKPLHSPQSLHEAVGEPHPEKAESLYGSSPAKESDYSQDLDDDLKNTPDPCVPPPVTSDPPEILQSQPHDLAFPQHSQKQETEDIDQALADLPSDAFESSSPSPEKPPARQQGKPVLVSSQQTPRGAQNLAAPQQGLRQMTLFGDRAQHTTSASQANKRFNWPLAQRDEPPTHHKLDPEAMKTWVYPTNIGNFRDYQFNIVARGLSHNLLVALPTGLGKTFIAATIMLNWFRWTKDAQIVFVAPTKPLVSQQVDACFRVAGIPRSSTVMLTGGISPGHRAEEWRSKRVFFMTPQTIINDLKTGICDPKRIVLLVVDEAHRATGAYAYVEVVKFIRRFNESFRVLGLTATPGNSVEAVQAVINGLDVARVEIRTEHSLDIREFVHQRDTQIELFDTSAEMARIMEFFSKAVQPVLNRLNQFNAYWIKDPMQLTAYGLTQSRQKWMSQRGQNENFAIKGMVNRIFSVLASLAHSVELLKFHGIGPFYGKMKEFRNEADTRKGGKYEKEILESEPFLSMMSTLQFWMGNNDFIGHPKLEYLQGVVLQHFTDATEGRANVEGHSNRSTRIMIFAHYRDSAEEIVRVLKRNQPIVKPHVFIGQAASKSAEGMDQKKQLDIINQFKSGTINTLVATSIGEEGLDIGEIDLIICYDSSASPIRMLQRMGRTGRKRAGKIVLLLMRGKEETSFIQAKDNYEKVQNMIEEGTQFEFHETRSRRIMPKDIQSVPDKRRVEIPVENTQIDLPEPKKRGGRAPKRPPKKFHMPDGVHTGFVSVSRMDGFDGEVDSENPRNRRRPRRPTVQYDLAPVPTLKDVVLTSAQQKEFERQYLQVHDGSELDVRVPELTIHPARQRCLQSTKLVKHGQLTKKTVSTLKSVHTMDVPRASRMKQLSSNIDLDDLCGSQQAPSDDDIEDEDDCPSLPVAPGKSRPKVQQWARTRQNQKAPGRKAAQPKNQRGRQSGNRSRPKAENDGAIEAPSSTPPPTAPEMALASQGIWLGQSDTSQGEKEADAHDSDLDDFIVTSSQAVNDGLESSSSIEALDALNAGSKRSQINDTYATGTEGDLDEDDDLPSLTQLVRPASGRTQKALQKPNTRKRSRNIILDDSSE